MTLLALLERLLFVFHALLIAFNMVGWAWKKTRVPHLIVLGLTAFSWFVMGAFYGWGYCLCTDWHFRLRRHLGYTVPESSFIQLFSRKVLGLEIGRQVADTLAVSVFAAIVVATVVSWTVELRHQEPKLVPPSRGKRGK
jgi:hypothetical protein